MNVHVTQSAEGLPRRAFTVKDVLRMVETGVLGRDERFELIGGEIVPMSPKGIRHEVFKQWLMEQLVKGLPDELQTIPETTFHLSDDTFIEPDFVVYPRRSGLRKLSPETCVLAIEIADSSLVYDLGRKARLYAQFGIAELWVFDVNDLRATVHRVPSEAGYRAMETSSFEAVLSTDCIGRFALDLSAYVPE